MKADPASESAAAPALTAVRTWRSAALRPTAADAAAVDGAFIGLDRRISRALRVRERRLEGTIGRSNGVVEKICLAASRGQSDHVSDVCISVDKMYSEEDSIRLTFGSNSKLHPILLF
ncbi:hypothetical protein GW17_00006736 [Ensete ventricosum]|nr:hypothetical protein GW17_00006736 [Ensete ventricosum]